MVELTCAMLGGARLAHSILGLPNDLQLGSSMSLFDAAGASLLYREAHEPFFGGEEVPATIGIVDRWGSPGLGFGTRTPVPPGGTPNRFRRLQHMSEDDDIPEIAAPRVAAEETNRLFRLTPATEDLACASRQMALVPADTEEEARGIATKADLMGRDWRDRSLFLADSMETPERHVVGEMVFRSVPNPVAAKERIRKA